MNILGLDITDESLKDTPLRMAKMYVQELFAGLNEANFPKTTTFNNDYKYKSMVTEINTRSIWIFRPEPISVPPIEVYRAFAPGCRIKIKTRKSPGPSPMWLMVVPDSFFHCHRRILTRTVPL